MVTEEALAGSGPDEQRDPRLIFAALPLPLMPTPALVLLAVLPAPSLPQDRLHSKPLLLLSVLGASGDFVLAGLGHGSAACDGADTPRRL